VRFLEASAERLMRYGEDSSPHGPITVIEARRAWVFATCWALLSKWALIFFWRPAMSDDRALVEIESATPPPLLGAAPPEMICWRRVAHSACNFLIRAAAGSSLTIAWVLIALAELAKRSVLRVSE